EFTFVGIPIMFVLISIFEISRGMWLYQTLVYAAQEGTRYAAVHGINCVNNPPSVNNNCSKSIAQITQVIRDAGVGLDLTQTDLQFISSAGTVNCTLSTCANQTSGYWPPNQANQVGATIQINIQTTFRSAIALLWPGVRAQTFGTATLPASSQERIIF
ncbi:MAG: TadE family protein, partial [Bryobacteraceae bacterium]